MNLSVLWLDDLLNPAVAEADDLRDVSVAQAVGAGLTDGGISASSGRFIPGDGADELSFLVGHAKNCTENLTGEGEAYRFLYMETKETTRYSNGLPRPSVMAQLPDWALRELVARHAGPALEAAKDEARYRGWEI